MILSQVTIVMVPRERYSGITEAIESLYRMTAFPFRLIVVDGCLPKAIKDGVDALSKLHGFDFIHLRYPVLPNEARNIGIKHTTTPFVVFADNDVRFTEGWLEPLLNSADEYDAVLVAPTVFDGSTRGGKIHAAGGRMWFDEVDGLRHYHMLPLHMQKQKGEVKDVLIRGPTEMVEFHVLLARTEFFSTHGLLDETLSTWADHDDLAIAVSNAKLPIIYDPRSEIEYDDPGTNDGILRLSDLPYFLLRWGEQINAKAIDHAMNKWGCDPKDPWVLHANEWIGVRRRRACGILGPFGHIVGRVMFRLNRKWGGRLERLVCGLVTRRLDSLRERAQLHQSTEPSS